MLYRVSPHVSEERFERIMYIMENLGIGEEVCKNTGRNHIDRLEILTSTGVVLIVNKYDNIVITAYVPTMKEAVAIWKNSNPLHSNLRMPDWLNAKVKQNRKHYEILNRMNVECGYCEKHIHRKFY